MNPGFRVSFGSLPTVTVRLLPAVVVGIALVGCSGSWPLAKQGPKPAAKAVYYVGASSVPLHREPGGAVVEELPRGTKVSRSRLDKGWAFVRVATSGREGWVDNAKLVWRAPGAEPAAGAPAESRPETAPEPAVAQEPIEPAAESTPAPVADEASEPDPTESEGTSVYDPF